MDTLCLHNNTSNQGNLKVHELGDMGHVVYPGHVSWKNVPATDKGPEPGPGAHGIMQLSFGQQP